MQISIVYFVQQYLDLTLHLSNYSQVQNTMKDFISH